MCVGECEPNVCGPNVRVGQMCVYVCQDARERVDVDAQKRKAAGGKKRDRQTTDDRRQTTRWGAKESEGEREEKID